MSERIVICYYCTMDGEHHKTCNLFYKYRSNFNHLMHKRYNPSTIYKGCKIIFRILFFILLQLSKISLHCPRPIGLYICMCVCLSLFQSPYLLVLFEPISMKLGSWVWYIVFHRYWFSKDVLIIYCLFSFMFLGINCPDGGSYVLTIFDFWLQQ